MSVSKHVPDRQNGLEQDMMTAAADEVARSPEEPRKVRPQPVHPDERFEAVDVLRGFALLGILAMNIVAFAWPFPGYENPHFSGGDTAPNVVAWMINSLLFSGKMMTLFSMLFGAGLVLMGDRAAARGASLAGTYYRRIFWLLAIGLVHAYLIWGGDILVTYALCGLLLYLFRRRSPRTLLILAIIVLLIASALGYAFLLYGRFAQEVAAQVDSNIAAGQESAEWQVALHASWNNDLSSFFQPDQSDFHKELALYRGGYWGIVAGRVPEVLLFQTYGFLFFMLWGAGGRMLLGMALMKWRVFSGERSWRFYRGLALLGYGCGLPLTVLGALQLFAHDYNPLRTPVGSLLFGLGMVPVALGHAAVVMMICKAGVLRWLNDRVAAVGRMALTNYLMQSLLATTLFYGYGVGLFGHVDRVGLWGIVLLIWAFQLWISPIWLNRHAYGPAEWLWRSLTYWRWQPLRHRAEG
ncbi:MAG: DUF418 domain-containing protein [Planctomycetota bacterium]